MKTSRLFLAGMAALAGLACGGQGTNNTGPNSNQDSCGVGPVPGYRPTGDAGANVGGITDAGVVEFDATAVGATVRLTIPVQDSFDVAETLLGASFSGPQAEAFQVTTTFPVAVPAGTAVNLELQFTPTVAGANTANLLLQTKDMGVSPIDVEGTGVADAG